MLGKVPSCGSVTYWRPKASKSTRRSSPKVASVPLPYHASKASIPMGMAGELIDITRGPLFLGSYEARYITGAELSTEGGWYAGC